MAKSKDNKTINEFFAKEAKKEFAFESGGVKYYQFSENGLPIYYTRLAAMQEKTNMAKEWRVTSDTMNEFLGIIEILGGVRAGDNRVKGLTAEQRLNEINSRVAMMRKRIEMGSDMTMMYELASVWFFDETEDPAVYDYVHARTKIKRWLEDREVHAFFLRTPLTNFLEFREDLTAGTAQYTRQLYELVYSHSIHNLSMLPESEIGSELGQLMLSQAETYLALKNLNELEH